MATARKVCDNLKFECIAGKQNNAQFGQIKVERKLVTKAQKKKAKADEQKPPQNLERYR